MSTLSELLAEHTQLLRRGGRPPAAGGRRVAAAGRHVVRRLPAVGAARRRRPTPAPTDVEFLCVAQARPTTAPTAHPEDVVGGPRRGGDEPAAAPGGDRGPDLPRRGPALAPGGAGAPRDDPGPATGRRCRRAVAGHEPRHAAGAEPAGDRLPGQRGGPVPDDRRRHVPAASVGRRAAHQPARRRRAGPAGRARLRGLRQPERAVGLPPDGARQRPRRRWAGRRHPRAGARPVRRGRGRAAGSSPRSTGKPSLRMEARAPAGGRCCSARCRCARAGTRPARWCWCATSPTCAAGTWRCCRKDATIREIHHRVKNNLQTVAALLRLQSRRTREPRGAGGARESVRRVNSIALVHEALSTSVDERVDLDALVDKVMPAIGDGATAETRAGCGVTGRFGALPAELATPLVMVLTELVHNAIAHAYAPGSAGEVAVSAERSAGGWTSWWPTTAAGCRKGFDLERSERAGAADRADPAGLGARLLAAGPATARGRDGGRHQPPADGAVKLPHVTADTVPRSRRRGAVRSPRPERRSHPDRGRRSGRTTAGPEPGGVRQPGPRWGSVGLLPVLVWLSLIVRRWC